MFVKSDAGNNEVFPLKGKPGLEEFRRRMEEYGELVAEVKKDQRSVVLGMETTVKEMVRAFENLVGKAEVYK